MNARLGPEPRHRLGLAAYSSGLLRCGISRATRGSPASITPFLLLVLAGCSHGVYEIELEPVAGGLQRTLVAYTQSGRDVHEISAAELRRLRELYPDRADQEHPQKHGFRGVYETQMPADVGGHGTFASIATSLGVSSMYVERFRGEDDLLAQVERRKKAADDLSRLVQGWCRQEFGQTPAFPRLQDFLEAHFARDLLNLSLVAFPIGPQAIDLRTNNQEAATAIAVRAGQYLLEREYFEVHDLPRLIRAAGTNRSEEIFLQAVRLALQRKLQVPADAETDVFRALDDEEKFKDSWNRYLRTTPQFGEKLVRWQMFAREPGEAPPDPFAILEDAAIRLVGTNPLQPSDELTLRLKLPRRPHATNGRWEEGRGSVVWNALAIDAAFPTLLYAAWSEPAESYQRQRFGAVVFDGSTLASYCLWRKGLRADEAEQWERLLDEFRPAPASVRRLEQFRFSSDTEGVDRSLADLPRQTILEYFEKHPPQ